MVANAITLDECAPIMFQNQSNTSPVFTPYSEAPMARIDIRDDMNFPIERVYPAFRDDLSKVADFLPNIEAIIVEQHDRTSDTQVSVVNVWKATGEEIPAMASSFIKPEMLQWTDHASWDDDARHVDWRMEVGFMPEAITCSGRTTYRPKGDGKTEIHISGELKVDARKLGVPRLIAGKLSSAVEEFVVKLVTPNLKATNRAMEQFLEQ